MRLSLAGGIRRPCPPPPETFAPTTCERENCDGLFIRFRIPVNLDIRPGRKTRGRAVALRTTGRGWRSMRSAELFMCRRDRRRLIFMGLTAWATIYLPTA